MTNQSKSAFLPKIILKDDYPPFKKEEIKLTGEEQIQSLIKFYLENKKIVDLNEKLLNHKKNAKRFKINCIVGENGTGKSRLLKKIIEQKQESTVLWDDFFLIEENLHTIKVDKVFNVNEGVFDEFEKVSKEGLDFNGFMNGIIFFNLFSKNIVLKAFSGRKIEIENIKFAQTKKPWFLPFNSKAYFNLKKIAKDGEKDEEKILQKCFREKYSSKDNGYMDKYDKLLQSLLNNNKLGDEKGIREILINKYKQDKNRENKDRLKLIGPFFTETLYACDVKFDDGTSLSSLSAGEKVILLRFTNIYMNILEQYNKGKKDFLILIDEPDLHLHLDWQRQYIQKLIDVFSTLNDSINLHFIIATHSPFLISDLPTECIVALKKNSEGKTEVLQLKKNSTFGANFVDLIRNGFFFKEQMLMGSFAETIIKDIAEEERIGILMDNTHESSIKKKRNVKEREMIKKFIGDDFLKDNLLYFKP